MAARLRVTWKKSAIGYKNNQKRTIEALGLRRLGHTVEHDDSRALRGMITTVRHLVEVTELDGTPHPGQPDESSVDATELDGTSPPAQSEAAVDSAELDETPVPAHPEVSKE